MALLDPSQIDLGLRKVDAIDSTYTAYIGMATSGTAESETTWRIKKIVAAPGAAIDRKYATGAWSSRTTLTYS